MRGRKPKPSALKLVTGNPGKRKLNKREPKPRRVVPSAPAHLTDRAREAWGSLAARLDRLGLLTELDAPALEQLCENYAEIIDLRADVASEGRTAWVTSANGTKEVARPQTRMLSDAEKRFRAMMAEFGMTPSSRSRVTASDGDDSKTDPAEAYFG